MRNLFFPPLFLTLHCWSENQTFFNDTWGSPRSALSLLLYLSVILPDLPLPWPLQTLSLCTLRSVLVCSGCYSTTPQTGWLKQQKFIPQGSRAEDAGRPRWRCWRVWFLLRPLSLAGRWLPSHCLMRPLLGAEEPLVSLPLLIRTPLMPNQDPTLVASCDLIISLKALSPI